ncbi:single-stranded-DNA-specific exonuclease RecJ [Methanothermobacter tenebrarum]|uniref:Single-stranded DNA-binding protein n=1 Tax=Methanothermobacter tenebrarum TaxID=680118 RepID=A0A328PGB7_9EURY|nr:single-stranded-DNA-specific exonuclease RecJ [Methanothermobacter tenebrarum]NPV64583.1 DHH family phosphoesterase [Methanobacteriaceae archaeon]RAO78686.1 single-stranded DNA-binding protein [Methanothermobacter tenebrarum]
MKTPPRLDKGFLKAKNIIESSEDIKVYSHRDCDGITAGAIISTLLERLGKEHEIEFINLNQVENIKIENELTIFTDMGSGQRIEEITTSNSKIIILDHHPPLPRKNLKGELLELNPINHGIDGSTQISGGGMAYLLSKKFNQYDTSWMGVLSAIGDLQNSLTGKLTGLNNQILKDSTRLGQIEIIEDLSIYGRQTRPIFVALSYFSDVNLPITNNKTESILLLKKLGIPYKEGERYRCLCDLTMEEKRKLFSELVKMLSREVPPKYVKYIPQLVSAEAYDLTSEEKYTPLRDLAEFSTAINACSRNNDIELAIRILKGERGAALDELESVSRTHRRYLAEKVELIETEELLKQKKNLQYFKTTEIKDNVIGTIAGMIIGYGDWRKPIIGLGIREHGTKVSLRCSRLLALDGIHFGSIIRKIAEKVGGSGGGHAMACGAYIPPGTENKFLELLDNSLKGKIG